jgi:hypothetical protein
MAGEFDDMWEAADEITVLLERLTALIERRSRVHAVAPIGRVGHPSARAAAPSSPLAPGHLAEVVVLASPASQLAGHLVACPTQLAPLVLGQLEQCLDAFKCFDADAAPAGLDLGDHRP